MASAGRAASGDALKDETQTQSEHQTTHDRRLVIAATHETAPVMAIANQNTR